MLLFWNTGCSFCQLMLAELKTWELRPLSERPQLLVVSAGAVEDIRVQGLLSTVVLDSRPTLAGDYGSIGTPSAVLVDEEGRPLHRPAVGVPYVRLALGGVWPGMTLPSNVKPVKRDGIEDEILPDGSMILYNTDRNQVLTLNGAAALVWECCDGDYSVDAILAEVRDAFSLTTDPEADVRQVLDRLMADAMIVIDSAQEPVPADLAVPLASS